MKTLAIILGLFLCSFTPVKAADSDAAGARIFISPDRAALLITGLLGKTEAILPGAINMRSTTAWVVAKNSNKEDRPEYAIEGSELVKRDSRASVGAFCGDKVFKTTKSKSRAYIEHQPGRVTICNREPVFVVLFKGKDAAGQARDRFLCYWALTNKMKEWTPIGSDHNGMVSWVEGREPPANYGHCVGQPPAPIIIRGGGLG